MMKRFFTIERLFSLDFGLLLLRSGTAILLFIQHGIEKIAGFGVMLNKFPDPLGIGKFPSLLFASFTDIVCAFLVLTGTFFRPAIFLLLINLLVAFILFHHGELNDHGEAIVLYLIVLFYLIGSGPGRMSVDSLIKRT